MTDQDESVYDNPDSDPSDPASAAAAQQTVTNDAVAGEPVFDDDGNARVPREAAPTENESAPADDGYLAPHAESVEEIDLDDEGENGPVTVTQDDPTPGVVETSTESGSDS